MSIYEKQLKPCPFCGGNAYYWACDRIINIGCKACNYHRYFHGLVQTEIVTNVSVNDSEWYDAYANEKAIEKWNKRAYEEVNEND